MAQLPSQSQFGDYGEWPGRDVLDSGGERLGGVREIYLDRETGRPEWVLVDVDGDEARFVPLADASVGSVTIRVAHSADAIRSAPGIGPEPRIDQTEERRLYDHYGLGYSETGSGSALPAEGAAGQPTREHEHQASGPTPTAWGAPDERGATPTGWGGTADPSSPWGTEEDKPAPWPTEEPAEKPVDPWDSGGAEARADAWGTGGAEVRADEAASSWSAAADASTNVAPPPAAPPSVEELEAAEIPEPPAATDHADDPTPTSAATNPTDDAPPSHAATTEPSLPRVELPSAGGPIDDPIVASGPDDVVAPSAAGEILAARAADAVTAEPEADLTAWHGPGTVRAFTSPEPPRIHAVPPPTAEPEDEGGALSVITEHKTSIAAGLALAVLLLVILRRPR